MSTISYIKKFIFDVFLLGEIEKDRFRGPPDITKLVTRYHSEARLAGSQASSAANGACQPSRSRSFAQRGMTCAGFICHFPNKVFLEGVRGDLLF
jgi:hypothetical protein